MPNLSDPQRVKDLQKYPSGAEEGSTLKTDGKNTKFSSEVEMISLIRNPKAVVINHYEYLNKRFMSQEK